MSEKTPGTRTSGAISQLPMGHTWDNLVAMQCLVPATVPMPIFTPRLQIRPRRADEGAVIAKAVRDSLGILSPWLPFAKSEPTLEQMEEHCRMAAEKFAAKSDFVLSIYSRDGNEFIGSTGLHRPNWSVPSFHIGYWVRQDLQGKGYVSEAVNAVTRYAFAELKANRVEIRCDSRNERSLAVMNRLGFAQEGRLRSDAIANDGSLRDTIVSARTDSKSLPPLLVEW